MGGIVINRSSSCCYGRRRRDLTPTLSWLVWLVSVGTRVTSQGVSSAPMGEQHQRLGSGESESFPHPRPCIGASGEAKNFLIEGCLPSAMSAGSRASWRCSETPCVRPRMTWRDGLVRSRGSLEAQQGRVSPWVSLIFPLDGAD
jgi:hypothetical protein